MKTRISQKTSVAEHGRNARRPPTRPRPAPAAAVAGVDAPLGDRPRIQEQQLDVEQQEHDRDQVVPDVEPLPGVADRVHARLVGHLLDRRRLPRAQDGAGDEHADARSRSPTRMNRKIGVNSVLMAAVRLSIHAARPGS